MDTSTVESKMLSFNCRHALQVAPSLCKPFILYMGKWGLSIACQFLSLCLTWPLWDYAWPILRSNHQEFNHQFLCWRTKLLQSKLIWNTAFWLLLYSASCQLYSVTFIACISFISDLNQRYLTWEDEVGTEVGFPSFGCTCQLCQQMICMILQDISFQNAVGHGLSTMCAPWVVSESTWVIWIGTSMNNLLYNSSD